MLPSRASIVIIEDSSFHTLWLQETLNADTNIVISHCTTLGKEGIDAVKALEPSLVLLDFQLADMTGLEVAKRIKAYHPHIKIFMITAHTEASIITRLVNDKNIDALGIKGSPYLEHNLIPAIYHVLHGGHYLDSSLLTQIRESNTMPGVNSLTKREFEIFIQLMLGKSDEDIATHLFVDIHHIKNMKSKIIKKIKSDNIEGLVTMLVKNIAKD